MANTGTSPLTDADLAATLERAGNWRELLADMPHPPLTEADLARIWERRWKTMYGQDLGATNVTLVHDDVCRLLSEVERLKKENERLNQRLDEAWWGT